MCEIFKLSYKVILEGNNGIKTDCLIQTNERYKPKICLHNTYLQFPFSNLYSVDINSTESLFGNNTILKSTNSELQKYCDCATEQGSSENSISGHYTVNCSVATEAVLCSRKNTSQPFTSTCESYQNRYKRDVNELNIRPHIARRSVDSDDVLEAQPLSLDPTFDPNFIPPVIIITFEFK